MANKENIKKRNPNWSPEEIKLILLLYFSTDKSWKSAISDKTPEIIALSSVLNKLNIHPKESRGEKFRSVGSIRMKLTNIRAVDENDNVEGLSNISSLDKELFKRYKEDFSGLLSECRDILNQKYKKNVTDVEYPYFNLLSDDKDTFNEFCQTVYEKTLKFRQTAVSFKDFKLSQSAMNLSYVLLSELSKYINVEPENTSAEKPNKKVRKSTTENEETPSDDSAAFVRDEIKKLLASGISYNELKDFQKVEWCKKVLHIKQPLLKAVPYNADEKYLAKLCKDENNHRRYWIDIFIIRSKKYIVCKEWFNRHAKYINNFLESRKAKQFTSEERIKKVADYIILEDKNEVSLNSDNILINCGDDNETKEILTEFRKIGILKNFENFGNKFVVEDYDMLYDVLDHPEQYILK